MENTTSTQTEISTKVCSSCKQEKLLTDFHKNKTTKDGRRCYCKLCVKEYYKDDYKKNRGRHLKNLKKYRDKNKKAISEYHRQWREKNKDRFINGVKGWAKLPAKYETFKDKLGYAEELSEGPNGELLVPCTYCGRLVTPTNKQCQSRLRALENFGKGENRFYCADTTCKQSCTTFRHNSNHSISSKKSHSREVPVALRQMALKRDNYTCQKCGATDDDTELHCHHIKAYADDPIESADLDNVIIYCKACHKAVHKLPGCGTHEIGLNRSCK